MPVCIKCQRLANLHRIHEMPSQSVRFGAGADHPITNTGVCANPRLARRQRTERVKRIGREAVISPNDVRVHLHEHE